jgi:hypothetical protein
MGEDGEFFPNLACLACLEEVFGISNRDSDPGFATLRFVCITLNSFRFVNRIDMSLFYLIFLLFSTR